MSFSRGSDQDNGRKKFWLIIRNYSQSCPNSEKISFEKYCFLSLDVLKQRMVDYFTIRDIVEEVCPQLLLCTRSLRTLSNPRFCNFNCILDCVKSPVRCVCLCFRREPQKLTFDYLYFRVLHNILVCQRSEESQEHPPLGNSVKTLDFMYLLRVTMV